MTPHSQTCQTCNHFNAQHEMCTYWIIASAVGNSLPRCLPETTACSQGYSRKTEPGAISQLFVQNTISRAARPEGVPASAQVMSWPSFRA